MGCGCVGGGGGGRGAGIDVCLPVEFGTINESIKLTFACFRCMDTEIINLLIRQKN